MHVTFRLPHLAGVLLLAASPFAAAESPLPDPIAPAVIGRPLEEIRTTRPLRQKPAVGKPYRARQLAGSNRTAPSRPAMPLAAAPAAPAMAQALPATALASAAAPPHAPKQAVDDRVDPRAQVADNVGQGTRVASKPLGPGAYFSSRNQALVRQYYLSHPRSGRAPAWKIGEPVPPRAEMSGVPDNVRAALPPVPPGLQYVQLDGEVVLVAVRSRMVVDGVSRSVH